MPLGLFHFQLLYNVLENIHFIHNEQELAQTIMDTVSKALNAEAGSIFKLNADQKTLTPLAAYGAPIDGLKKMKFMYGKGVVGWVAQFAQPVRVDKPSQDPRFMGTVDTSTGFKTTSILAAPILSKGQCVGVLEFINRRDGPFSAPDLELVSMVGREVGIAFENAQLFSTLQSGHAFEMAILDSIPAGVLVVDDQGRLVRMNPSARRILPVPFDEEKPEPHEKILEAYPGLLHVIKDIMDADSPVLRKELNRSVGARNILVGYSCVPIYNKAQKRIGSALLFEDITAFLSAPEST